MNCKPRVNICEQEWFMAACNYGWIIFWLALNIQWPRAKLASRLQNTWPFAISHSVHPQNSKHLKRKSLRNSCEKWKMQINILDREHIRTVSFTVEIWGYRLRWYSCYRACHWTQCSRVQTRPRAIRIRNTTSFRKAVKPSAPCRKILRHVTEPLEVWSGYFVRQNSFPSPVTLALLLDDSIGRITKGLWWTNQEFSPVDIIPRSFSMLTYNPGMNNRSVGGRSSVV
jgi:hypothetical protein